MRRGNVVRALACVAACGCLCWGAFLLAGPGDHPTKALANPAPTPQSVSDQQPVDQTAARPATDRVADPTTLREVIQSQPPVLTPEEEEKLLLEAAAKEQAEAGDAGAGFSEELEKLLLENQGKLPPPDAALLPTAILTPPEVSLRGRSACVGDKDINGVGTTAWTYTLNVYYKNRRSTSIYLASEFGCSDGGPISAIRYYVSVVPAVPMVNLMVRVRHTTLTTYPSTGACFDNSGWTVVYGPLDTTISTTGWYTIPFAAPFMYNGTDNLEVDVTIGTIPTYNNSGTIWSFTGTGYRSITAQSDTIAGPANWTCGTGNPTVTSRAGVPRAQFVFPPPTVGACCVGYTCYPEMSEGDCLAMSGVYKGDGSSCTPNPCVGACCVNYVCVANNNQTECDALGGTWYLGEDCATFVCPPWNDNCSAVTPVPLTAGVPVQFNGNNLGATNDCAAFAGGQVWEAFSLPADYALWDVTLNYCGTPGPFGNAWLNLATTCPCSVNTAAGTYDTTTCGDGNVTIRWKGLAPGNYWYPVLLDPALNAAGPYVINVVAVPGYCESRATSTADETIKQFVLGAIDNTTTNCDTYDDFTYLSTPLQRGSSYPLTLVIGDCENASCYSKWAAVYIDWDQNYAFDTGELAWASGQLTNTPCPEMTVNGLITVPITAALGPTRIRVIVKEVTTSTPPPACGTYTWGATEDYTGVIELAPPTGACCFGVTCEDSGTWTQEACLLAGGRYAGDGSTCAPLNPCFGACCFQDGSCLEVVDDAACAAAGGINFSGTGTTCTPNLCPQPGNDCANPKIITLPAMGFPYVDVDTTCGRVNEYADTCLGSYDGGEDIIYRIDVTEDMCLVVDMDTTATWTGMAIDDTCPLSPGTNDCLYKATITGAGGVTLNNVMLYASVGTYYLMIDTYPAPNCIPQFTLTITRCPTGACCVGETCSIESPAACTALGGTYVGTDIPCDPNPCLLRACCFWPSGTCVNLTEEDCGNQGGTWNSTGFCSSVVCPTPGDTCEEPFVVTLPYQLPFTDANQTTCGRVNDYADTCLGSYDGGEDIIYKLEVTEPVCVNVAVQGNTSSNNWIGVAIDLTCPLNGTTCYKKATTSGTLATIPNVELAPGVYYMMVDTYPAPNCLTDFTLTITPSTGCPIGACCLPTGCEVIFQSACTAAGGVFGGIGSVCSGQDCNANGVDDFCDLKTGTSQDCNANGIPDECDIANGAPDIDLNGVPDECQPDCNNNGVLDACELPGGCATGNCGTVYPQLCGTAEDCQPDGIPDDCQLGGGFRAVIWDNGPMITGPGCTGDISVLQDTLGLNSYGLGAQQSAGNRVADDFTLTAAATINTITIYTYQTGATPPTITSVFMQIWNGPPNAGGSVVFGDLSTNRLLSCTAANIFRTLPSPVDCTRHIQACVVNIGTSLPAGTYWIDYTLAGTGTSGPWVPPVTILGLTGKPGANALQYQQSTGAWAAALDGAYPQDFPFLVEGTGGGGGGGGADCNANGIPDDCDILYGPSLDCNNNGVPDECEVPPIGTGPDCNNNGIPDDCELAGNDCNGNNVPDDCDIALGTSNDCQGDGIPDECQLDTRRDIILAEGFEDITNLPGWFMQNNSEPLGTTNWFQGNTTVFNAQAGSATSYIGANYNNTGTLGNISNWLLTPEVTLVDGMVLDFYTRGPTCTTCYADRLQVRASLNGASTNVGTGWTAVGDFTMLLLDVNPTLVPDGYPQTWDAGHFTVTISGVPTPTQGRLAFRYFVEDAGANGTNSNYIGIDTVTLSGVPAPPANDCNQNGVPDECDIHVSFGGYCEGAIPTECDSDYNTNGVPDHCEICGDLNGDGAVDGDDYWIFVDAFGWCVGAPKYNPAADMDGSGCVNLLDYQSWLVCYRMYNGRDFSAPKKKLPAPAPAPLIGR